MASSFEGLTSLHVQLDFPVISEKEVKYIYVHRA